MFNFKSQKGVSLYYAILMMSISLAVALGVNSIAIKTFRTTQEVKKAPPALHAADTGVEEALYSISQAEGNIGDEYSGTLESGAEYYARIISPTSTNPQCPDESMYCIYSSGTYQGSKRFIKAVR